MQLTRSDNNMVFLEVYKIELHSGKTENCLRGKVKSIVGWQIPQLLKLYYILT